MGFTNKELSIMADAVLALTKSTRVALDNTYDYAAIMLLYHALDEYQELNKKICLMLE